ncbi:hypothetical protein HYW76_02340 [Candidatus Pacearchaeota archaeon]|nr:hypothetical protein [Candidatus Pacearchaeota archaeon]
MIKLKEIAVLLLSLVIMAFSDSFFHIKSSEYLSQFLLSLGTFAIIIIVYEAAKKIMAHNLDSAEETKIWTVQRYGLYERAHFKYPIPLGILLSFFLSLITLGNVKWFALTESEVKPTEARAVRRHEYYSYYEMTEWHLALISAAGIIASFLLAIFAYLISYAELSKLSIYFAFFNLLPIGKLDGTRIFFGSRVLYAILAVISIISLGYAFLLP